jgi:hypothetical protein
MSRQNTWTTGSAYARVLPLPVGALTQRSFPRSFRILGMTWSCTGVGVLNPRRSRFDINCGDSENADDLNEFSVSSKVVSCSSRDSTASSSSSWLMFSSRSPQTHSNKKDLQFKWAIKSVQQQGRKFLLEIQPDFYELGSTLSITWLCLHRWLGFWAFKQANLRPLSKRILISHQ